MTNMVLTTDIKALTGFTVSFAEPDSRNGEQKRNGERNRHSLPKIGDVPYIPASSLRGRLRHVATSMVVLGGIERQLPKLRLADVNWLAVGGVRKRKAENDDSQNPDIMRYHPIGRGHLWSFWGFAEPIFMAAALQIEIAMAPGKDSTVAIPGQRTDLVQRPGNILFEHIADPESAGEWLSLLQRHKAGKRADAAAAKGRRSAGRRTSVVAEGEDDSDEVSEVDAEAKKTVPQNMPFTLEMIKPGTEFCTYVDISNATDLQLGMFVATLREFAKEPFIGAKARMNLGLCDMTFTLDDKTRIVINGRQRSFEAAPVFIDLEKAFWDKFPTLDFTMPVLQ